MSVYGGTFRTRNFFKGTEKTLSYENKILSRENDLFFHKNEIQVLFRKHHL